MPLLHAVASRRVRDKRIVCRAQFSALFSAVHPHPWSLKDTLASKAQAEKKIWVPREAGEKGRSVRVGAVTADR